MKFASWHVAENRTDHVNDNNNNNESDREPHHIKRVPARLHFIRIFYYIYILYE